MDGNPEYFTNPEELKAALERRQMEGEVNVLAFQSLLAKADTEEMRALSNTFLRAGTGDDGIGIWYAGIIAGILHAKTGLCFGCNKDHSVSSADFTDKKDDPTESDKSYLSNLLEKYRVMFMSDERNMDAPVKCSCCGRTYPSLQDRILRANCPDCEQKAKWG